MFRKLTVAVLFCSLLATPVRADEKKLTANGRTLVELVKPRGDGKKKDDKEEAAKPPLGWGAIGLAVAAVAVLGVGKVVSDMRKARAVSVRPKQPWEVQ
jgi:hypothetical protein